MSATPQRDMKAIAADIQQATVVLNRLIDEANRGRLLVLVTQPFSGDNCSPRTDKIQIDIQFLAASTAT